MLFSYFLKIKTRSVQKTLPAKSLRWSQFSVSDGKWGLAMMSMTAEGEGQC